MCSDTLDSSTARYKNGCGVEQGFQASVKNRHGSIQDVPLRHSQLHTLIGNNPARFTSVFSRAVSRAEQLNWSLWCPSGWLVGWLSVSGHLQKKFQLSKLSTHKLNHPVN